MTADRVTINHLTFNTMGAPFKPDIRGRYQKLNEVLHKLIETRNVHVVTLQETFHETWRDDHLVIPWKEKFKWHAAHSKTGWFFLNSGLTTLSRLEIAQSDFSAFSRAVGADWFVKKGVLHTRLKFGADFYLDVYNSHTQASYISQRRRSNVRINQFQELLSFMIGTHNPLYPVLLTGDLNTEEYNIGYDMLINNQEFEFIDVMRRLYPDRQLYPFKTLRKSSSHAERKLDHVMIREGQSWILDWENCETEVLDFGLSDHKAVLTSLAFVKK